MAKSMWRRGSKMVPYLGVLLTCHSAYIFLLAILENLADPKRMSIRNPVFLEWLQIPDFVGELMIPVFFMIAVIFVLFLMELHAAWTFLRAATKMDPDRDASRQLKLCKIWTRFCIALMFTEPVGSFLVGKYIRFCYNYTLVGRILMFYVVYKFMEELKVAVDGHVIPPHTPDEGSENMEVEADGEDEVGGRR